jgi:hypothetical protein
MSEPLSGLARVVLWDYDRGSLAYDVLCLLLLAFVLAVPAAWLADPMAVAR